MVKFPATVQVSAGGVENIFDIFLDTDNLGWQIPYPNLLQSTVGLDEDSVEHPRG